MKNFSHFTYASYDNVGRFLKAFGHSLEDDDNLFTNLSSSKKKIERRFKVERRLRRGRSLWGEMRMMSDRRRVYQ